VDARRLFEVQLRLECKALDGTGRRVVRIEGDDPDPIAACTVVRFRDGCLTVCAESAEEAAMGARAVRVGRCSTYVFHRADPASDPAVVRKGLEDHAVVVDGREVSRASSSRSNDEAAELWVRTEEDARGRGYGMRAALAWAAEVNGDGRIAFYSHLDDNAPSRRLAAKLGVVHLFDLVTFTIDG
jgi:GNAT superfamily N-acetyltransferase